MNALTATKLNTTGRHCSLCGRSSSDDGDGYTTCCNETFCYSGDCVLVDGFGHFGDVWGSEVDELLAELADRL